MGVANAVEFGQSGVKFKGTHFSTQKKMGLFKEQRIIRRRGGAEKIAC